MALSITGIIAKVVKNAVVVILGIKSAHITNHLKHLADSLPLVIPIVKLTAAATANQLDDKLVETILGTLSSQAVSIFDGQLDEVRRLTMEIQRASNTEKLELKLQRERLIKQLAIDLLLTELKNSKEPVKFMGGIYPVNQVDQIPRRDINAALESALSLVKGQK